MKKLKAPGRPAGRKITKPALVKAIEIVGGITKLSRVTKIAQSSLSTYLYTHIKIPATQVPKIVKAVNGKVGPEELRPDVFVKMPDTKE